MKFFLTGATGFIGKFVIKNLLSEGHKVMALVRKGHNLSISKDVETLEGDLSKIESLVHHLKKFKPDITIHLAWEGIPNYDWNMSIKNLKYGLNLFQALSEINCKKIICVGSCWEYGVSKGCLDENLDPKFSNPFTTTKNSLYYLGNQLCNEKNIILIWARLFYVYGPGQKQSSLIPHIIHTIQAKKELNLRTPGARNDFVYVDDVAKGLIQLASAKKSGVYNIGTGKSESIEHIVKLVTNIISKQNTKSNFYKTYNANAPNFWANISKIKKDFGWVPKTSLSDGIELTIKEMKNGRPENNIHKKR